MGSQRCRVLVRARIETAHTTPRARVSSAARTIGNATPLPYPERAGIGASEHTVSRQRWKHKGRSDGGTYFAIPHAVMRSPNWRAMPPRAVKLVCDLGGQYRGSNNGDLTAAWRIMRPLGWNSRATLAYAIADALRFGMIEKTRQGGLHVCSLYALTWLPIHECGGKLDVSPTRVPSGLWQQPPPNEQKNASTESVSRKHGIRVNSSKAA
jgi:hypothetical protein